MSETEANGREIIRSFLKTIHPFDFLEKEILEKIACEAKMICYPQGSYIFREGERSKKTLFVIMEGEARAVASMSGEDAVTAVRGRGDFFGVTVLLSDEPYPVSMQAFRNLTCLLISQASFQAALGGSERFADFFTKALTSRLKEVYLTFAGEHPDQHLVEGQTLRQRVAEVATTAVVTCLLDDSVRDVARRMSENNVSSVVVTTKNGRPAGIITEKDLVGKIMAGADPDLGRRAEEIMSANLLTVRPNDFTYKALLLMFKHNIKHVVVTAGDETLQGIATIKDLMRTRSTGALSIVKQIEYRQNFAGLAEVIGEVDQVKRALLTERSYASEICALVSELYDRITRKVIHIAEAEMAAEGCGPPPAGYCFINMGSAGRQEQFSRTDQDNGIIIADLPADKAGPAAEYFLQLGTKIAGGLEHCGFQRCRGEVMADNPRWCKPLSAWKESISQWVEKLDSHGIRDMTIFLDNRFLSGDAALYDDLKAYTTELFRGAVHALLFMAEDDLQQRVPLNIFRQIITERSGRRRNLLNLKSAAMVHLVDCLRLFALREGITETNSFERIRRLRERGVFKTDDADYIEAAFESLQMFRIRDAFEKSRQGRQADNYIDLARLTRKERALLKESLLVVNRLQSLTAHAFYTYRT